MAAAAWVEDDRGERRKDFDVGENVYLAGEGLAPAAVYEVFLVGAGDKPVHVASLMTDRHGALPPTAVVPYLGVIDQHGHRLTHAEADNRNKGKEMAVRLRAGRKRPVEARFAVAKGRARRPQVFPADAEGRLLTGAEVGRADVFAGGRGLPSGCVRFYLVEAQRRWYVGDPLTPVTDAEGVPVVATVRLDKRRDALVHLWAAKRTRPGSYQVIARPYRPGWYDADDLVLQAADILSDRRISSLVLRTDWESTGLADDVVPLTPDIAGQPLPLRPYFHFVNNFPRGTDVYAALDPGALPPGLHATKVALYVIAHKEDWSVSNALADVSGPGGTPAVEILPVVPGCINWNETLVWPNPQTVGKYDLVADFGNNNPDPALFATDGRLDPPLDMIDGYVRVGFWVTDDPGSPGPFAATIGQHDYDLGNTTLKEDGGGTVVVDQKARMRYPATAAGMDTSVQPGTHPLVVMQHGNSSDPTSYLGYDYLLDHLASHGFIAMSIHIQPYVMIESRARNILRHIQIASQLNAGPGLFQGHVDMGNIGIAGHSRGAEAVPRTAQINTAEGLNWNIKAGLSLAPTDFYHHGVPGIPLCVLYGSNDGDVAGWWYPPPQGSFTCFDIYDEAGPPRSFVFVYGANHDSFNTVWATAPAEYIAPTEAPHILSEAQHHDVAKAYFAAYFQTYLMNRPEQKAYFTDELKPAALTAIQVFNSHEEPGGRILDDFEQLPHDPATNTLGGSVTEAGLAAPPQEDFLHSLDSHSPHMTAGVKVAWSSASPTYVSQIPSPKKDVSAYDVISFRVTQTYGSAQNPAGQPQDLFVRLTDHSGKSRRIRASLFAAIPYPYERANSTLTKSALSTVRIPLLSFVVANAGADTVNLKNIDTVTFELAAKPTGEIEIDQIHFGS
jgi:Cutinase